MNLLWVRALRGDAYSALALRLGVSRIEAKGLILYAGYGGSVPFVQIEGGCRAVA